MTPSPEHPVAIESVVIRKIVSAGINVFDDFLIPGIACNCCAAAEKSGEITLVRTTATGYPYAGFTGSGGEYTKNHGRLYLIPKNAGRVYIKCMNGLFVNSGVRLIAFFDVNKMLITYTQLPENGMNIPSNAKYFALRIGYPVNSGSVGDTYADKVFISFDIISDWSDPLYKENGVNLTLRSLPDGTHDEYKDGKIIRRVGMLNLTGQENWVKAPMAGNQFAFEYRNLSAIGDTLAYVTPNLYCNYFSQITADESWNNLITGITTRKGLIRIKFADQATIDTVDKFKSWLSTRPVYVLYPLAGEQVEEVKIPILPSQNPYTQVYTDSPIDTDIEWEILTSSNNDAQIDDLIARVTALESEAVNAQN